VLRLPREIHPLKELKDDRHIHESSSYRDRLGVGIADSRKSNVSSKGATSSLRGLHPSLRCDDRKSGGVTARRNFNAGATSHDRNRTNDKRHKVYNRRDARQPLTALTALGFGQLRITKHSASNMVALRLVEVGEPFFAPGTLHSAHIPHGRQDLAARPQVYRGCFPAVVLDLKLNVLTFIERAQAGSLDSRDVHEDISAAACRLNKAIAFLRVEPLHRAGRHCRISELTI